MRVGTNFCKGIFLFKISVIRDLVIKREKGKKLHDKLFSSSIMSIGGVQIHWFKLVTICKRRELRNLDLWLLRHTAFSVLLNVDHFMERAICLMRSFCLYPIEFMVPSNSPWAEYIFIKLLLTKSKLFI